MWRHEFPRPRVFSGEGGQTGPAQMGAVSPAWLGSLTGAPRILGREVFEVVS
jgi:hypothetical protein